MKFAIVAVILAGFTLAPCASARPAKRPTPPHNLIVFVADGLRSRIVTPQTAPELARLRTEGVDFRNSHSLYPTITTVNGSAIATGHGIGDTGDFGNAIWVGQPMGAAHPSNFAFMENDDDQRGLARMFGGNYLNEQSLLATARKAGWSTAAVGKLGPTWVQDAGRDEDPAAILIDSDTGKPGARVLPAAVARAMAAAGLQPSAPEGNEHPGDFQHPGVKVANVEQQDWMAATVTKVLLPMFKQKGAPFALVFWSCDPDCTQHNQGDSLNSLVPGVGGPTSLAGVRNADADLGRLRAALKTLGLDKTTDIVVTADHGFSVMSKQSQTSAAARQDYPDTVKGFLPRGFFASDMARALDLKLWDARGGAVDPAEHPKYGGVLLGPDPQHPKVMIAVNGGSELIYLPQGEDRRTMVDRIMGFLTTEDYVGGVFVDDALGEVPGALPMSAAGLMGLAITPHPVMAVSLKSYSTGCPDEELCAAEVADTSLQQGQGIHGSFSRANTHNFMAAVGPDFKARFLDTAPVSNADIAPTLARIVGLPLSSKGKLKGRVIGEALVGGGATPKAVPRTVRSKAAAGGFVTVLNSQSLGPYVYLDAAGMPGRVVGLKP